eukprot:Clim_evm62s108 gene=Clim_evmTU62s108
MTENTNGHVPEPGVPAPDSGVPAPEPGAPAPEPGTPVPDEVVANGKSPEKDFKIEQAERPPSNINDMYDTERIDSRIQSSKRAHVGKVHRLEWSNLRYSVDINVPKSAKKNDVEAGEFKKEHKKRILRGITGYVESREMFAILGASGAGKTTMLDALSGRLPSKDLNVDFKMNNEPTPISKAMERAAYVQQSDELYPMLTVYETIMYAAKLKINKSQEEREDIVEEILDDLQLNKARDTRVGNDIYRGVSGGERRRVTIGVEIVARPDIIILDEPTSGLDSSTAANVCSVLRTLAKQGRIVICTIHQPSARLITMFDRMTFLGEGRTIYDGKPADVGQYFSKQFQITMPRHVNVAEFVLDVAETALAGQDGLTMDMLHSGWDDYSGLQVRGSDLEPKPHSHALHFPKSSKDLYANNMFSEIAVLTHRASLNNTRNPELMFAAIGISIFNGIILGLLYRDAFNSALATVTIPGFIAFTLALYSFTQADALPIFLQEREILKREISRWSYRVISYTVASSLVWPPIKLIPALLYTLATFWLLGLSGAGLFFFIVFVLTVAQLAAQAFCLVVSVNAPNFPTANVLAISSIAFMFLFSGYFIPPDEMPDYLAWIRYFSLLRYGINSLVIAVFEGSQSDPEVVALFDTYDLTGQSKWQGVGILIAFYFGFRFIFFILLWLKTRRHNA